MSSSEYHRQYYLHNKERLDSYLKDWYVSNKERILERARERYRQNKEKIKEKNKSWQRKNPEKVRLYKKINAGRRKRQKESTCDGSITVKSLKEKWTGECAICTKRITFDHPKTHLDHIHPLSKGGTHTIDNVQWTCAKCNLEKFTSSDLF
jgi:5-methylcytosine-specific restriction endonuclease McrA